MLTDKISSLRRREGWSQEDLADRLDVSRQSVSEWESGASQPALDDVLALSRLFGVSTDYLLKDEPDGSFAAAEREAGPRVDENGLRLLSEADVNRYLENRRQCAPVVARGAALCVTSPAPLIALLGVVAGGYWYIISARVSLALGLAALIAMIAIAVSLFIAARQRMAQYDEIIREPFALTEAMRAEIEGQRQEFRVEYRRGIRQGVELCILSVVPVIAASFMYSGAMVLLGVCALLVLVAMGVYLFVRDGMIMQSYDRLIRRAEYR